MQALVLEDYRDLQLRNISDPEVGPQEVLIRVRACGIVESAEVMCTATTAFPAGEFDRWSWATRLLASLPTSALMSPPFKLAIGSRSIPQSPVEAVAFALLVT